MCAWRDRADMAHYQEIYRDRILTLPHIADIEALMQVARSRTDRRCRYDRPRRPPTARSCARCSRTPRSRPPLGAALGLSQPATWRRIKRLTEAGVIGRRLELDLEALGFGVTVFLGVKLATKGRVSLEDFERAVSAIPEVQTVEHVLGLYDYRLRVVARDLPDFERVLRRRIMTLPGVGGVEANVVLSEERRPGPPRFAGLLLDRALQDPDWPVDLIATLRLLASGGWPLPRLVQQAQNDPDLPASLARAWSRTHRGEPPFPGTWPAGAVSVLRSTFVTPLLAERMMNFAMAEGTSACETDDAMRAADLLLRNL
jgi:Lrp/AsnC family leucine-responsive transcriptional regulator